MSDVSIDEIIVMAEEAIQNGATVYIKWTCPNCGERVTADEPNTIHTQGYRHEDCGFLYTGDQFGIALIWQRK